MSEWLVVGVIFLAVLFFGSGAVKKWAKTAAEARMEYDNTLTKTKIGSK